MEDKDKIDILLHEYDTLRERQFSALMRTQQQISMLILLIVGALTIIWSYGGQRPGDWLLYALLMLGICISGMQ